MCSEYIWLTFQLIITKNWQKNNIRMASGLQQAAQLKQGLADRTAKTAISAGI